MDGTQKAVKKTTTEPEDSPRTEMCFCLHRNTMTAAVTRGTKSNKADRAGSREGEVSLPLAAKGEKKKGKRIF